MTGTELALPEDLAKELATQAATEVEREPDATGYIISTKGKKFKIGEEVLPDELIAIVVGIGFEQAFYDRAYDPNKTVPPACFALADAEANLVHHDDSPAPKFDDSCADCPLNQWDTGANGKGKACKAGRRLVLLGYSNDPDDPTGMEKGQLTMVKVAPTSIKAWAAYSKTIVTRYGRPTSAVITKITFNPKVDYPQLEFELDRLIDSPEEIQVISSRREEAFDLAMQPYNVTDYEPVASAEEVAESRSKMS